MRLARMVLAAALVVVVAWPVRGDSLPYPATVQTDNAEVRCKAGIDPAAYVTQKLPRGSTVEVVEKRSDGWLKIYPPKGSISWVKNQIVQNKPILSRLPNSPDPGIWVAEYNTAPVPVLVESIQQDRRDTIAAQIERGTVVVAVAPPKTSAEGDLLPIQPPPGEYRYIRETDVSAATSAPSVLPPIATVAGGPSNPSAVLPVAASSQPSQNVVLVPSPAAAPTVDPLIQQADQLERSGDKLGAARLYDQLGGKYLCSNRDTAMQYYNRAAWLRATAVPATAAAQSDADALYQQARQYEQGGNRIEAARLYMRLGDLFRDSDYQLAMKYYHHAGWLRQNPTAPPANAPVATTAGASPQATPVVAPKGVSVQMIGPGVLRRSAYPIDGRPTYVLNSAQEQVIAYLTPQPGVDMEHYLDQNVELLGEIVPRPDVAGQFMSVMRVRPLAMP